MIDDLHGFRSRRDFVKAGALAVVATALSAAPSHGSALEKVQSIDSGLLEKFVHDLIDELRSLLVERVEKVADGHISGDVEEALEKYFEKYATARQMSNTHAVQTRALVQALNTISDHTDVEDEVRSTLLKELDQHSEFAASLDTYETGERDQGEL